MKKIFAGALAAVILMFACAFAQENGAADINAPLPNGEGVEIAFVVSDLSSEGSALLMDACAAEAEKYGAVFMFSEAQDIGRRIGEIERFARTGADVIICEVSDPDAMQPCIKDVQARGVRFVACGIDTRTSDMFFGADDFDIGYKAAENACRWIADAFDESENVKVGIANYPDFAFLAEREAGIRSGLKDLAPNAVISVVQQAGFALEGLETGTAWAETHPDINCVIGVGDDGVLGICRGFEMAGIDVSARNGKLGFFGCEATEGSLGMINSATAFRGTVAVDTAGTARELIQSALVLAGGGEVEHDCFFDVLQIGSADWN